jgi:hypothetical protein
LLSGQEPLPDERYDPDFLAAMAGAAIRVSVIEGGRQCRTSVSPADGIFSWGGGAGRGTKS